MIFLDSNVVMYLIGADHPNQRLCRVTLEEMVGRKEPMVTNVEVLQEILHRYTAIRRFEFIQPAFDLTYSLTEKIFDITEADVLGAKEIVLQYNRLSSRDSVHASQMRRLKIDTVFSFDQGFDVLPHLKRIPKL